MLRLIARRLGLPIAAHVVLWIEHHWPNRADLFHPDTRLWPVDVDAPVDLWPADVIVPDDARELAP